MAIPVPIVGMGVGAIIGGVIGAVGAGMAAEKGTKAALDLLIDDDAKALLELIDRAVEEVIQEYLLSETELQDCFVQAVKEAFAERGGVLLRAMYKASKTGDDAAKKQIRGDLLDPIGQRIADSRPKLEIPSAEAFAESAAQDIINEDT